MKPSLATRCVHSSFLSSIVALSLGALAASARANGYATSVKLNGSATDGVARPDETVTISHVVIEPATLLKLRERSHPGGTKQ